MRGSIIKPLPESVKSSVRSGILVFDLTRVVEELIFNSLDAGATKVVVSYLLLSMIVNPDFVQFIFVFFLFRILGLDALPQIDFGGNWCLLFKC